jgi:peptidoglycan/LPS O-acetylase OafA/YrhL
MNTPVKEMRFQGIQILRFFCAAGVVVYHSVAQTRERLAPTWNEVPWSHLANVGVLFFFAISGFVLTQALQKEAVTRYLVLRFLRIYPAFFTAVLVVAAFRLSYGLPVGIPQSPFGYLLLIPDGIGPANFVLGGVEWTLKHEVFYYVLLGLLWSFRRDWLVKLSLAGWALLILAFTIRNPGVATQTFPEPRLFPFSTTHLPFIGGVFSYLYRDHLKLSLKPLLFTQALFLGSYEFFLHTEAKYFCVALAAMFALASISAIQVDQSRPLTRTLIGFGDGSYGLYLLHVPVQLVLVGNLVYQNYPPMFVLIVALLTSMALGLGFGAMESAWYRWARLRVRFGRRSQLAVSPLSPGA